MVRNGLFSIAVRFGASTAIVLGALLLGCTDKNVTAPEPIVPAAIEPITGVPTTAIAGTALPQISVRVVGDLGQRIEGVPVTFAVTAGGGSVSPASTVSGAQGVAQAVWTLGTQAGVNRLEVRAEGLDTPLIFESNGTAGPGKNFVIVSGADQTDTVSQSLPVPIVLRLTDANGNPVAGEPVNWYFGWTANGQPVTSGTVTPMSATTNANGEWSATWTLGPDAGQFQITAVAATSGMALGIVATARPDKPDRMTLSEPGTVVEFNSVTVQIRSFDRFGNQSGGLQVNLEPTNGSTVTPTTVTTDAAGNGSVTWTMPEAPASVQLIASTPASAITDTANAAVVHGPPVRMVISPDTAYSIPMTDETSAAGQYHANLEDQYGHVIPVRFTCGGTDWTATPPAQVRGNVGLTEGFASAWAPQTGTYTITATCRANGLSDTATLIVQ
ncbi:MAG TPA: Ig-like domain-containing protein [Gemmatimonadaceae bacterium]|nr:Ig-like domain-containing protein [Gemmatimonadaceae bacterium]